MIHVVIDTCIYRKDPSRSGLSFRALERLIDGGRIQLHLPYIVEREFQTQQHENYAKAVRNTVSELKKLSRKSLPQILGIDLKSTYEILEQKSDAIIEHNKNEFSDWLSRLKVNRVPLSNEQSSAAFEAYFTGAKPFKSVKNRNDIPDAFIVEAIRQIHKEKKLISVVSEDKAFLNTFGDIPTIKVHESLQDFIESNPIQENLKELDILDNFTVLPSAFMQWEEANKLVETVINKDVGEMIMWKELAGHGVPGDSRQATVTGYGDVVNLAIDFKGCHYFGGGEFGLPFSIDTTLVLDFIVHLSDYFDMVSVDQISQEAMDADTHFIEVDREFEAKVLGNAVISLDLEKFNFEDIQSSIRNKVEIESVDEIEIGKMLEVIMPNEI